MADPQQLFARVYDDLYDQVHSFCARRVGYGDADDAAADVFAAVWRRIDDLDEGQDRAWVFAIARGVVLNHWRSKRRKQRLVDRVGGLRGSGPANPEVVVVQRDQDSAVVDALRQLSQRDQEVLMLSTWDDLSAPEIAIVLDISVNAAQQRIFRARKRLARLVTVEHPGLFDVSTAEGSAS